MVGSSGTREISKRYPVEEGLTARTTKQEGTITNLLFNDYSNVQKKDRAGL